ncbi:hypothetical protein PR003_g31218 [Phytophthora rubi]|uniref:HECT domain-containing protein n=1 Tax=Phytophthora rubi TaxID=129364 RepID=A0A6A4B929_9STRA|nr:hypothetical protein PR003_g31218 [Phytophthora rubi]
MFEESMEHLGCIEEKYMQSVMRTNFIEESGVGAGGLHHEWFMMLTELLTNTKAGLFKAMQGEDRAFFLNSSSRYDNVEDHLMERGGFSVARCWRARGLTSTCPFR